jgi:hypothetical protein
MAEEALSLTLSSLAMWSEEGFSFILVFQELMSTKLTTMQMKDDEL